MKKLITICLLSIYSLHAIAQQKKELTKEETLEYLQKKMAEVKQQWIVENNGSRQFIDYIFVGGEGSELKISDRRKSYISDGDCGDWQKEQNYDFNPVQISEISDFPLKNEQSLGYLQIKLTSKTGKSQLLFKRIETRSGDNHECNWLKPINDDREFCEYIFIPYLKSDPTNFSKLKKGFEHLKKLSMQSDDPFAN